MVFGQIGQNRVGYIGRDYWLALEKMDCVLDVALELGRYLVFVGEGLEFVDESAGVLTDFVY